jgi:predicted  nucleic acid-binding Zn-ribbon protein
MNAGSSSSSDDEDDSSSTDTADNLKKQIQQVEQQIKALETENLPEDEKKTKKETLNNQLSQLQTEYIQALQDENSSSSSSSTSNGNTSTTAYGAAG